MIEIDGSLGEGGGAMLRSALGLSMITGKPFRMKNIRSGRPEPGLKRQHLHCIRILQQLSNAKVEDAHLGSESIMFIPGEVKNKSIEYDTETAASTTLISQCLILATIFSGKRVKLTLKGGTDVNWSIPAEYLSHVHAPLLAPLGDVKIKIHRRGYYPKGQGILEVTIKGHNRIEGSQLPTLEFLHRGNFLKAAGNCHASLDLERANVARRISDIATLGIKKYREGLVTFAYSETASPGTILTLWARFNNTRLGTDGLGKRGKSSEQVAHEALERFTALLDSDAVVDEHMADQLIPYLAICGGALKTTKITDHTKSNIYVAEQFTEALFRIEENNIIRCE
jgi:RNA 3'-phosphate cyclase